MKDTSVDDRIKKIASIQRSVPPNKAFPQEKNGAKEEQQQNEEKEKE